MLKLLAIWMSLQMISIHCFEIRPRIVNGFSSNPQDFPFYVHLKVFDDVFEEIGGCGGTILTDTYVSTNSFSSVRLTV